MYGPVPTGWFTNSRAVVLHRLARDGEAVVHREDPQQLRVRPLSLIRSV